MKSNKIKNYEDKIDFGKYQGQSILYILEHDIEYAIWLSNNCKNAQIGKTLLKDYFNKHSELKEEYFKKFK